MAERCSDLVGCGLGRDCFLAFFLVLSLVVSLVAASPASPAVGTITASDSIDLASCSTKVVWCNATASDADGWTDIDAVNATLWDPAATTEAAADDNSNHYTNSSCPLGTNTSLTDVPANCSFTLQYYANAAEWTCKLMVNDSTSATGSANITTVTVNQLIALDAENLVDFGSLDPGATSSADVNNTITNCGNVQIDINLSGADLTNNGATVANITVGQVKYNVTSYDQDYTANMTALSAAQTARPEFDLAKRTNGASTKKTYWKIKLPSPIQALTYTGTITFTAVLG